MSEEATLKSVFVADTSGYDKACDHIVDKTVETANQLEAESEKLQSLLTTEIPKVDLGFLDSIRDVEEMREGIGNAFAMINRVVEENEAAIAELTKMYAEVTAEANKFANVPSMQAHYKELKQQKVAIKELIAARKQAIASAKTQEKQLEKETKSLIENVKKKNENASATQTLRQRIKELEAEAALLAEQAEKEGHEIDQNTGRYREIIEELGRLRNIRGDISQAGSVFANDEAPIKGVIQGLQGLSASYQVAQGVMGLFGSENEKLNEIMLKVQSIMAITIGLQQVQQVLNKDSTFSLITLNTVKKLFGKHTEDAADAIAEENAKITENIIKTEDEAAAKELSTVAEEADTAAEKANTTATQQNSGAQKQQTLANKEATASQNEHTGSMVASTFATKTLTAATKLLKLALISTGIGALIVLVGELVSWVTQLFGAEDEAIKRTKELNKINEEATKTYIQEKVALEENIRMCQTFKGTKEQEQKKVDELNSKYGESLGYYDSLAEWEQVLVSRGPAYCEMLMKKAEYQGIVTQYVQAYVDALELAHRAEQGDFDRGWYNPARWFGESNADRRTRLAHEYSPEASEEVAYWKGQMDIARKELEDYQKENGLDIIHIDPKAKTIGGKGGDTFDPKKAAQEQKKLLDEAKKMITDYIKKTNADISQAMIDSMTDGYYKEINALHLQMKNRRDAWTQDLLKLAEDMRTNAKASFMTQKGATEDAWAASTMGQRSLQDWVDELLSNDKIKTNYEQGLNDIAEALNSGLEKIRKKYFSQLVKDFGTYNQKFNQLSEEWQEKIGFISTTFPEFLPEALKKMDEEFANLKAEDFKLSINWDVVFGDLENQSLQSLEFSLDKVRTYFTAESKNMTVEQIKIFQEAMDNIEEEIASRNPFTAMHKSFSDISASKTELVSALQELAQSQDDLNKAQYEYNEAFRIENDLRATVNDAKRDKETYALIDAQKKLTEEEAHYQDALAETQRLQSEIAAGNIAEDSEEYANALQFLAQCEQDRNDALQTRNELMTELNDDDLAQSCIQLADAQDRLAKSSATLTTAQQRNTKAEQNTLTARNKVTRAYKTFANNLKAAGKVTTDVGGKASKLARVFSDDIADGMDKALECIDEVLDATGDVISAIGDMGKSVSKGMAATADAAGQATQSTAQATATSISTVEKASVILTVISAALQIATAIANLFNNDDKKQKEIERLQERIDQLQWELDNQDAVRLQQNTTNALDKLRECYSQAREEVLKLHGVTRNASAWTQYFAAARYEGEIYAKTVEKIADYWAQVGYTADKALGSKRYDNARSQLENLAEQQMLVQRQMNEEMSKKKTDDSKVQDYKNKIAELAEEMATLINEMLEDIIGASAEDISKTLGDAFIEAARAGEDAMKAWGDTVNDIVADILKRMMIQQVIEPEIGKIFDKYKKMWFGDRGVFQGFEVVKNSMNDFANDINAVSSMFGQMFDQMPDDLKAYLMGDEERSASERGIATASQDSVDENNARLTVIQSHTYTLVQGVAELNATGLQILDKLARIDENTERTADTIEDVQNDVRRLKNAVDDITTQGLKLKS